MRYFKFAVAMMAAAALTACGGGSDRSPKIQYSSVVSFGDSLSDIGTYGVGTVKLLGGGKYSINSPTSKNWIELIAAQLGQPAPCAAQTGLDGLASQGFSVAVTNFAGCTAYAQGGARVTNPVGPGNKLLGGSNAVLGQLTVPVVTQIQSHLTKIGGSFRGDEIVFLLAGGNDVFINLATVGAGGDPTAAVVAMGTAGAELAIYVKTLIIAKGAKFVTVVNLPDVSKTPFALSQSVATQGLISSMVTAFNTQLQQGLNDNANVVFVDAYTVSRDQFTNPVQYGLTNVTIPACDLSAAKNALGSSLVCTTANLIPGVTDRYQYADAVHPTPYGYQLIAQLVSAALAKRGWL